MKRTTRSCSESIKVIAKMHSESSSGSYLLPDQLASKKSLKFSQSMLEIILMTTQKESSSIHSTSCSCVPL